MQVQEWRVTRPDRGGVCPGERQGHYLNAPTLEAAAREGFSRFPQDRLLDVQPWKVDGRAHPDRDTTVARFARGKGRV